MNESHVICNGNELPSVLADLRQRNLFPWAMDTSVGAHNANYRVSYFQTFPTSPIDASSGTSQSGRYSTRPAKGAKVAGRIQTKMSVAAGGEQRPEKVKSVTEAPASISLPPQPLTDLSREGRPTAEAAALGTAMSIEERMAALRERLSASGKLKRRKPSTNLARLPYSDA